MLPLILNTRSSLFAHLQTKMNSRQTDQPKGSRSKKNKDLSLRANTITTIRCKELNEKERQICKDFTFVQQLNAK